MDKLDDIRCVKCNTDTTYFIRETVYAWYFECLECGNVIKITWKDVSNNDVFNVLDQMERFDE